MRLFIFSLLSIFIITSCSSKKSEENIIAEVNGEFIYSSDLEPIIQQQIFDELNRIYSIKSQALDRLIEQKLLVQEAKKQNLTESNFINWYIEKIIEEQTIDSLIVKYQLNKSVRNLHRLDLMNIDVSTYEGKLLQKEALESFLTKQLIDSLLNNSLSKKYLYPPKSPHMDLEKLTSSYRGNLESEVCLTIISDFDCSRCHEFHAIYENIYKKYKEKVKFGYIHYSSFPSPSIMASEAARNQNKFWEFHDIIYNEDYLDTVKIFDIARSLDLNLDKFRNDFTSNNFSDEMQAKFEKLSKLGIYGTPTIVINGRLLFNSTLLSDIQYSCRLSHLAVLLDC